MGLLALVFHWEPRVIYRLTDREVEWWVLVAKKYLDQFKIKGK
jgi:hypothetical protein